MGLQPEQRRTAVRPVGTVSGRAIEQAGAAAAASGRAIANVVDGLGQIVEQEARSASQEAGQAAGAAAPVNLQRDEQGNLMPVALPARDGRTSTAAERNVLIARYTSEVQLDMSRQMATLSETHRQDPEAFQAAATAYRDETMGALDPRLRVGAQQIADNLIGQHTNRIQTVQRERQRGEAWTASMEVVRQHSADITNGLLAGGDPTQQRAARALELDKIAAAGLFAPGQREKLERQFLVQETQSQLWRGMRGMDYGAQRNMVAALAGGPGTPGWRAEWAALDESERRQLAGAVISLADFDNSSRLRNRAEGERAMAILDRERSNAYAANANTPGWRPTQEQLDRWAPLNTTNPGGGVVLEARRDFNERERALADEANRAFAALPPGEMPQGSTFDPIIRRAMEQNPALGRQISAQVEAVRVNVSGDQARLEAASAALTGTTGGHASAEQLAQQVKDLPLSTQASMFHAAAVQAQAQERAMQAQAQREGGILAAASGNGLAVSPSSENAAAAQSIADAALGGQANWSQPQSWDTGVQLARSGVLPTGMSLFLERAAGSGDWTVMQRASQLFERLQAEPRSAAALAGSVNARTIAALTGVNELATLGADPAAVLARINATLQGTAAVREENLRQNIGPTRAEQDERIATMMQSAFAATAPGMMERVGAFFTGAPIETDEIRAAMPAGMRRDTERLFFTFLPLASSPEEAMQRAAKQMRNNGWGVSAIARDEIGGGGPLNNPTYTRSVPERLFADSNGSADWIAPHTRHLLRQAGFNDNDVADATLVFGQRVRDLKLGENAYFMFMGAKNGEGRPVYTLMVENKVGGGFYPVLHPTTNSLMQIDLSPGHASHNAGVRNAAAERFDARIQNERAVREEVQRDFRRNSGMEQDLRSMRGQTTGQWGNE